MHPASAGGSTMARTHASGYRPRVREGGLRAVVAAISIAPLRRYLASRPPRPIPRLPAMIRLPAMMQLPLARSLAAALLLLASACAPRTEPGPRPRSADLAALSAEVWAIGRLHGGDS